MQLVFYDISNTRTRTRLAMRLEQIGMIRIQKSVFAGQVKAESLNKLVAGYRKKLKEPDKLFLIKVKKKEVARMAVIGVLEDADLLLRGNEPLVL